MIFEIFRIKKTYIPFAKSNFPFHKKRVFSNAKNKWAISFGVLYIKTFFSISKTENHFGLLDYIHLLHIFCGFMKMNFLDKRKSVNKNKTTREIYETFNFNNHL